MKMSAKMAAKMGWGKGLGGILQRPRRQAVPRSGPCLALIFVFMSFLFLLPSSLLPSPGAESTGLGASSDTDTAKQEQMAAYSAAIERYVNQHWRVADRAGKRYRVAHLSITKRERIEALEGEYSYFWVVLHLGMEIDECVACFWEPDRPTDPSTPFELKGIFVVERKPVV